MSIMIPPEFEPIAKITVGQEFPQGDEDKLAQLGAVWDQAAEEINQLIGELNPATAATFESLEGAPAEQFAQFVNELSSTLPVMSGSAQQLAALARNVALEIEYAKYMIILQLAWMAAEIAYLTSTLFGSAAIPAVVTAGRFAIQMILRELFTAIIASVVAQVGMDVAVQLLQFLKGDRKHWDVRATVSMAEMGALGGVLGGVLGHAMRIAVPDFAKSLVGHVTTGALTGVGAVELNNAVFNAGQNVGLGAAAGAVGGAIAHGHSLRGGDGAEHINVPELDLKPFTPEMMKQALSGGTTAGEFGRTGQSGSVPGQVPGEHPTEGGHPAAQEEQLGLPEVPKPFDASRLPDASPEALVRDFPSAPGQKPVESAALRPQVERRVDELSGLARKAELPAEQWRPQADSVREAIGRGDLGQTAQRLREFRTAVESGLVDQRMADFRSHVESGFSRLGELGVREDTWQSKVDAVERAQRTGDPVLVDSALKEYTDFVERHLPTEVLTGKDAPQPFDSGVEQLRRELATVSDPGEQERVRNELALHQQMRQRLDRLAQSDPEQSLIRRRTIAQEEEARTPEEAAQARQSLQEYQQSRDTRRQPDDPHPGATNADLERRLGALRESAAPDPRGQELRQQVEDAATPQEREQALRELAAHNELAPQERRLNALRETLSPSGGTAEAAAHREQLVQRIENARTPEEARQANQALREYTDRQIAEGQQNIAEQLRNQQEKQALTQNDVVRQQVERILRGYPEDPREAQLRQQLDAAPGVAERQQAVHQLIQHRQELLQQRVDNASTPQERKQALNEQARFNNWTPTERQLAELRTGITSAGGPADAHRAELLRQVTNARTPEEGRRAQQALDAYTDRQIQESTRHLQERLRASGTPLGQGPRAAATHEDLMRRFDALRDGGTHQDPREAELMRRMEGAKSPQEAAVAEQALKRYLGAREQQREVREQQRLTQVRSHEQEVTRLRDQLTQQRRTGALDDAAQTQQRLEQAQERLTATRTRDENAAALRQELRQQVEGQAPGSDRPGGGTGSGVGSGSGGRLDRLVQEGISRQAEQERTFAHQDPAEHVRFTEHEIDALPSAPTHKPERLPSEPAFRPDTTTPAETRLSVEDLPNAPRSEETATRIASEIEDLPSAPASPPARLGAAQAGTRAHEQAPTQAGPKRVEPSPSAVRPGSDVAQVQRSRPASDAEAPSAPTADPRVDRATMRARIPQVADLERTLAELQAHDTPAQPPKPSDVRTEAAGPEQRTARVETPTDHLAHLAHLAHRDTAGTPTTDNVTGMPRATEHTTPATPTTAVPKPPPLPASAALRAAPPGALARRDGSERAPQDMVRPVADPVRPEQWQHRRADAPSNVLRTERFDPLRGRPAGDGTLPGRTTLIRAEVRRIQAEDGRWVRDLTLHLPVRLGEGFTARMLPEFEQRWRAALDGHFNTGLRLPTSGDQLHIGLRLTPVTDDRAAVELSMSAAPGVSDQTHFRLRQEDPAADPVRLEALRQRNDLLGLHELAHFAGLPDTYLDPESVFRDTAAKSDGAGIMADITRAPGEGVPRRYLEAIESAVDSGPVVHDHPLSAVRDHPLSTDVPTTVGATGRPEPLRQVAAEDLAPGDGVRPGEGAVAPVAERQEVASPQTVSRELRLPGAAKRPDGLRVVVSRTRQPDGADVRSLSLVDAQGRPLETLRVEPHVETDASTGRPVARVALVPTGAPDAPRERLVIDGATGQPVHETLAHRDGLGLLSHYTRYDHATRKVDVLDDSGRAVSSWLAGGRLLLRKVRYLGAGDLPSHGLPPLGALGTPGTRPGAGARPGVPVGPSRWPTEPGTGMRMPFRGEDVFGPGPLFGPRPIPGHGLPWTSASPAPGARAAGFRPELGEPPVVRHQDPGEGATGPSSHWAYQVARELLADMGSRAGEPAAEAPAPAPRVASAAPTEPTAPTAPTARAAAIPRFAGSSRFELVDGLYRPVSVRDRGDETPLNLSAAGRTSQAPWDQYVDEYPDSYYARYGRVPHGPRYNSDDDNVIVFGEGAQMYRERLRETEHAENPESVENRERAEAEARERAQREQAEREQARRDRKALKRAASEQATAERALREHDQREKARQDEANREREALRRALREEEEREKARREAARREREPYKRSLREKKERDQADQRAVLKRALRTMVDREKETRELFRRERAASERALREQDERDQTARRRARREREALKRAVRGKATLEEAATRQGQLSRSSSTSSTSPLHSIDENDPTAPGPYRPTVQPPNTDGAGPSRYRGTGAPDGYQPAPVPYHRMPQPFFVNNYQEPPQQPFRYAVDQRADDWGTVYVVLAGVVAFFVLAELMDPAYHWGPYAYGPWGYRRRPFFLRPWWWWGPWWW